MDLAVDRVSEITQDAQRANDAMRQHWNSVVGSEISFPNFYRSVAVLFIHWADWLDPGLECDGEVCTSILQIL